MNRAIKVIVVLVINLAFVGSSFAAGTQLGQGELLQEGKLACGLVNGIWEPGKLLKNGAFLSFRDKMIILRKKGKKAKGERGQKLKNRSKKFKKKRGSSLAQCYNLGNGSGSGSGGGEGGESGGEALHFDLSGAVGLALAGTNDLARDGSGSNLFKVTEAGALEEVVESGNAPISKFLIAPNNKLYALFEQRVNLISGTVTYTGDGCLLAEIDTDTGNPTCVEDQPSMEIFWETGSPNDPIQFDATGAVYYVAWDYSSGVQHMRKYLDGEKVDIMNDGMRMRDFLTLADGTVFLTGESLSTQQQWLRRLSPEGSLKNIITSNTATFLRQFPDGNVYFGHWGDLGYGVSRYLVEEDELELKQWIGTEWNAEVYHDRDDYCQDESGNWLNNGFCANSGAYVSNIHETLSDKIFVLAGYQGNGRQVVMQYYPEVKRVQTVVSKALVSQLVLNHLVIAGVDASNVNVMSLYDTGDGSEIQLIGADNEVEVYHVNFSAARNKIFFDGLRFIDNKYVIGQVDLQTMEVTVTPTGGSQLVDFQTFS